MATANMIANTAEQLNQNQFNIEQVLNDQENEEMLIGVDENFKLSLVCKSNLNLFTYDCV